MLLKNGAVHTYESLSDIRDRRTQREIESWLQKNTEDTTESEEQEFEENNVPVRGYSFYRIGYDCSKPTKHHVH